MTSGLEGRKEGMDVCAVDGDLSNEYIMSC